MSFEYKNKGELLMLKSTILEREDGINHFYSTKQGGTSRGEHASLSFRYTNNSTDSVHQNFEIAAKAIGGEFSDIVRTQQVHRDKVCKVDGGSGYRIVALDNDGLITNVKGVVLSGFYADCQVLLFYDRINRAIGLCHSGWRGTVLNISKNTIDLMEKEYGTKAENLLVTVGPSICQSCFECDKDVYDAFRNAYGREIEKFFIMKGQKYHPDVNAITKHTLMEKGVREENIDISKICTFCAEGNLFWSHRRHGEKRGVHGAFIVLNK